MNFLPKKKLHSVRLCITLLVCLGSVFFFYRAYAPHESIVLAPFASVSVQPSVQRVTTANVVQSGHVTKTSMITARFSVGDTVYPITLPVGSSVYDAMLILSKEHMITFHSDYFSGLGYFIDSIEEVSNTRSKYWTLYVNGIYSKQGASSVIINEGDRIAWKFE